MPDYNSDAGLLSHLQIQKQNIGQYKNEARADGAEITSITEDHDNMDWIMNHCTVVDEYKTTAFGVKRAFIRGKIGAAVGSLVTAPDNTPPSALVAGVEQRSRERDARFKLSQAMTEAARLALDLVDSQQHISPDSVKPTVEPFPAAGNYEFALVVANRGESDMYDVQIRRKGSETWSTVQSGTGKSVNVTIVPTTAGNAEQIQVRVQLRKKNANYGQPSDPVYVTVNP
jgi:hypothetical protein